MDRLQITAWEEKQIEPVLDVWQRALSDRKYDFQMHETKFRERVLNNPAFDPEGALVAEAEGKVVGFALAVALTEGNTGFLSVLMVDPAYQRQGIGSALLKRAEAFLAHQGKEQIRTHGGNPIRFSTGVDVTMPAYYFLLNRGYRNQGSLDLYMQMDFADFEWQEEVSGFIEESKKQGIRFGLCEANQSQALCRFLQEHFPGLEASVKEVLTGEPPYPVFVATDDPQVVGFSGPLWVQPGGYGGFRGIAMHPDYQRRKIGTVLFNLMCAEFKKRGAAYTILYTDPQGHAQKIYFRAGFKVKFLIDQTLTKCLI